MERITWPPSPGQKMWREQIKRAAFQGTEVGGSIQPGIIRPKTISEVLLFMGEGGETSGYGKFDYFIPGEPRVSYRAVLCSSSQVSESRFRNSRGKMKSLRLPGSTGPRRMSAAPHSQDSSSCWLISGVAIGVEISSEGYVGYFPTFSDFLVVVLQG